MIRTASRLGFAMALCASAPAWADSVSGSIQDGYGRLSFTTSSKVSATTTGGVLAINFSAKTDINPQAIVSALPRAIASGKADADGKTLRFVLNQPVKLHVSQQGNRAVVDMAGTDFTGTMPDLPPPPKAAAPKPVDVASLPEIKLRSGAYANFTRLVFDWPKDVGYHVFPGAGKMTIRFDTAARADVSAITRFAPPWVKNAAWRIDGQSLVVEFETDSDSGYHDFKDGTHVVLDILAPKTDTKAYAPPGTAKPGVTAMTAAATPLPPPSKGSATNAQTQAILQASATLAPKKPESPKPETKPVDPKHPEAKPADVKTADAKADPKTDPKSAEKPSDIKTAEAKPAEPASTVPTADGHATRDGAVVTFHNAATLPAAVFVRGLTAWIILENAPNFDARNLKPALSGYAANVEASSSGGLGILRITLKAPAEIGARVDRSDMVVEIGPKVAPPGTIINFARNQNDPRRASLSTLLPAADHAFPIADPAGGDTLTVVPALPGRGVPAMRVFADFAVLPSASGLVVTPYADDLKIDANQSRVTIMRPSGLALTPPQMPVAQSPSALAHFGDGPSYLDFARWGISRGGSFLATERRLTQAGAKVPAELAGSARLTLARFYIANGFAAEALGLIRLAQANDPALSGDPQLVTMKAAAEYMMGRYRDAHNDLGGPAFDGDRHAALWRGLTEAGMEDWQNAHSHLEQALPVIARYPVSWQAEAALADAQAALGMNRLDLADAALSRLPKDLDERQKLTQELLAARLAASESRGSEASEKFEEIQKSGDEKLAAQAIYYRTEAALKDGSITQKQAIEQLEKLRFRWRGDGLELKTLRKLAAIYFQGNKWRDGLRTLRIATVAFPGQDAARVAQDDMRNAFVNLYLKGGADKMKPVESLALFYDNIDLTPIGPDGDEMIRRMSDRLVQVDLLGPAAALLAYQVDKRLDGIAKAQVATKLAAVYLMDHKADKAVATIRESQITGLPDDEMHQRLILEARAFAALKQWDNALDLIAVDQAADTKRLRADIYWEAGQWSIAGQKAEEFLGTRFSEPAPLTDIERADLLRATVAYSLANDSLSLERLRNRYAPKMKGTADANLFNVLSSPIDQHGMAFRQAAAQIAAVDTLQAFMKDFNKRRAEAKS